jgi:hypothetical protein
MLRLYDFLESGNGYRHVVLLLPPDEELAAVSLGKTRDAPLPVIETAREEIAGDAEIKCAVAFACNDVDGEEIVARHRRTLHKPISSVIPGRPEAEPGT